MNKVIISLGANTPAADAAVADAMEFLNACGTVTRHSGAFHAPAEGNPGAPSYLNNIVELSTLLDLPDLLRVTKDYETQKRIAAAATPLVAIDIDIVVFNGAVLRPEMMRANYFTEGMKAMAGSVTTI